MNKSKLYEHLIVLYPAIFMVILLNLDFHISINTSIKIDTIALISGNLFIAIFIAYAITKKHKNEELQIDSCFKEILSFEKLIEELRTTKQIQDDYLHSRTISLMRLKVSIVEKYKFVKKEDIEKLKNLVSALDEELTGNTAVNTNYTNTLLQLEKRITVTKSNIL